MLLFFCPSVTWLAFYICNTQKLGLLFKRHRERERERGRERGRERENVKWKSAIAVIYQSGVRPQQRTSKWECHGNVRRPVSGTRSRCPPLASLPRSILRWERHRSNKGEEVPHPLLLRLLLLLLWCYGNNKGLNDLRDSVLWQACGRPKEVSSARKTRKYRVAFCLMIQQLTGMKLKFSVREEKHGNQNSFSGNAVEASAKLCPVLLRCGWVV